MLNTKKMKAGTILRYRSGEFFSERLLLLTDLKNIDGKRFTADVFWFDNGGYKEQQVPLYQSENWTKLC